MKQRISRNGCRATTFKFSAILNSWNSILLFSPYVLIFVLMCLLSDTSKTVNLISFDSSILVELLLYSSYSSLLSMQKDSLSSSKVLT